jgi:hypothetical protein
MFLFGHVGIGLGLAWLLAWKSSARVDYRLVLFGAILPDLIDKPLGIALGLETRVWAHTFLFLFAVLALGLVPVARNARFVGFGVATHLLLDQIWVQPRIVLYPAFFWMFPPAAFDPSFWFDVLLRDPYVQAGEIIGAIILIAFALAHRIRSWKALREFVRHGILPQDAVSQP